jgi:hypothetical protein
VVDEPVSIGILVWVLSNIFGTSVPPSRAINWAALLVAAGLSPWSGVIVFKTCPVTAERCVKNHRVVSEVVVNAAGGSTNVTGRLSPQCWVRKAEVISAGIFPRGKFQILMVRSVHSYISLVAEIALDQ